MGLPDFDSSVGHSFGLEVDGVQIKQISEVTGLKMEQDVIELKQNTTDGKYIVKKLPGRPKAGEVTVTRGLTEDNSFERWIRDSRFGQMMSARRNGSIIVYAFELPRGYVDGSGTVHRDGVMRLATARDELVPLRDDRVRENAAYLSVVLIGRVITRIGSITDIHPGVIEN